jgi:Transglycosylase-like domain
LSARRSLIIAGVGILSLGVGATAAAATTGELANERERMQQLAGLQGESAGAAGSERQRSGRRPEWASADGNTIAGVPRGTLEATASCKSGGNPRSVSSDGSYRGKYQFDTGTWASVGGSGDPAQAPEAEQDYRAALLYQRAGTTAWPVCG